ncbi:MAG: ABC transporter ATP-binding protein [Betaproteobacteria bacterium]|nr:MAG: ABC transporter ATP-binding protein [Betaproteobacteria bacterium]
MSLLAIDNLSLHFGGVRAVEDVSFRVEPQEVFTVIGPNGAGKTSIFNLISRFYDANAGRIAFEGRDITAIAPHEVAQRGIARTFQNVELFEHASVLENLLLGRHVRFRTRLPFELLFTPSVRAEERAHREKVEEVIDFLDLQHYRDTRTGSLPYGVRKVVELGRALASGPKLLLLDEPSSGLNNEETEEMSFWIEDITQELGIAVLMIEHDMALVREVSDRVLAINYGRIIAAGDVESVQAHPEVVRAYLGE